MKIRLLNLLLIGSIVFSVMVSGCKKDDNTTPNDDETTGTFKDTRDGKEYKWVKIGNQTWMAENLTYTGADIQHITDNTEWEDNYLNENTDLNYNAWCYYDNNEENGNVYGVLYQWEAAKKACPDGWHLPSIDEWNQLENYLIENGYSYDGIVGNDYIAKSLALGTGWHNSEVEGAVGNSDYSDYINKTGFSAVSGGLRFFGDGSFINIEKTAQWWSANDGEGFNDAYCKSLYNNSTKMEWYWPSKLTGLSVRCVKD